MGSCHGCRHLPFPVTAVHGELPVERTRFFMDTSKEILGGCVGAVSWMTDEDRVEPHPLNSRSQGVKVREALVSKKPRTR